MKSSRHTFTRCFKFTKILFSLALTLFGIIVSEINIQPITRNLYKFRYK